MRWDRMRDRLAHAVGRRTRIRVTGSVPAVASVVELTEGLGRVATGFRFTEGPLWLPGEDALLFSDIPADRIYQLGPRGRLDVRHQPSHHANGLARDLLGRLLACEHGTRRVTRREADGTVTVLAAAFQGQPLNSPNDLVVAADGSVWFTDPPYGIRPDQQVLPFQGVFRLSPGAELAVVARDFDRPNGLAFSPDGTRLYVADSSGRRHLRVFRVREGGELQGGEVFARMDGPAAGVPDGLKVARTGHVFTTGPGGIWVLDPAGTHLGTVLLPETTSNCAWGDADGRGLYVTASTSVYHLRVKVPGGAAAVGAEAP